MSGNPKTTFVERIAHSDQETSNTLDKNEHLDEGIQPIYSPHHQKEQV